MDQTKAVAEQLLASFPRFFKDAKECAAIAARFTPRDWEAGAEILSFGKHSDRMYFLPRGACSVSINADDLAGGAATLMLGGNGDGTFVGSNGCLRPGATNATVRSAEALRTLEFTNADLTALLTSKNRVESRAAAHLVSALGHLIAERVRRTSVVRFERGPGNTTTLQSALENLNSHPDDSMFDGLGLLPPTPDTDWKPSKDERERLHDLVIETLGKQPELKPLGDATREMLGNMLMLQNAQQGDVIISTDSPAHGIYVVLEGAVRVRADDEETDDKGEDFHTDRDLGPGSMFGLISYILGCSATATVVGAASDTKLAVFTESQVKQLMQMADAGLPLGGLFRHWIAGQLADDARALNNRILAAFKAWSEDGASA